MRRKGSVLCRIALWECFGDVFASSVGNYIVSSETGSRFSNSKWPIEKFSAPILVAYV